LCSDGQQHEASSDVVECSVVLSEHNCLSTSVSMASSVHFPAWVGAKLQAMQLGGYEHFAAFVDPVAYNVVVVDPLTVTVAVVVPIASFPELSSESESSISAIRTWAQRLGMLDLPLSAAKAPAEAAGPALCKLAAVLSAALEEYVAAKDPTTVAATCGPTSSSRSSAGGASASTAKVSRRIAVYNATEDPKHVETLSFGIAIEAHHAAANWRGHWLTTGTVRFSPEVLRAAATAVGNQDAALEFATAAELFSACAASSGSSSSASSDAAGRVSIELDIATAVDYYEDGSCQMSTRIPVTVDAELPFPLPIGVLTLGDCSDDGIAATVHKYASRFARRVAQHVEISELATAAAIVGCCNIELGDTVMKSVRRKLPLTREPFNFRTFQNREAFQRGGGAASGRGATASVAAAAGW
jgi:hypothetical protein